MKFKTILTLMFMALTMNVAFASFPVQRQARPSSSVSEISVNSDEEDEIITPMMGTEKSQGIALILALVLGLLAAHRWYLGRPWPFNIIFIFTLGGFGIWLLVDIIRIITGDLGPAKGRYKKNFF
jgi:TM2 domain-containing membrane protein YozV